MPPPLGEVAERSEVGEGPLSHRLRRRQLPPEGGAKFCLRNPVGHPNIISSSATKLVTVYEFGAVKLFGATIQISALVTLGVTVVVMVLLTLFVKYTRVGRAMIAVSEDRAAAQLMGINVNGIITVTFAIGSALAALAGLFYLLKAPAVSNTMGAMPGIKAFTAAVIGGIGSIPGAMLGGILLGIVESISYKITAIAPYTDAIEFSILIIILLVRPTGFLGKKRREKV